MTRRARRARRGRRLSRGRPNKGKDRRWCRVSVRKYARPAPAPARTPADAIATTHPSPAHRRPRHRPPRPSFGIRPSRLGPLVVFRHHQKRGRRARDGRRGHGGQRALPRGAACGSRRSRHWEGRRRRKRALRDARVTRPTWRKWCGGPGGPAAAWSATRRRPHRRHSPAAPPRRAPPRAPRPRARLASRACGRHGVRRLPGRLACGRRACLAARPRVAVGQHGVGAIIPRRWVLGVKCGGGRGHRRVPPRGGGTDCGLACRGCHHGDGAWITLGQWMARDRRAVVAAAAGAGAALDEALPPPLFPP